MSVPIPLLPAFQDACVLVVGDVMLDRYWYGAASRISPEAPVPVVRVERVETRPGGAANVALNVAGLGAEAHLIGVIGTDAAGSELRTVLADGNVRAQLIEHPDVTTITKLRVVSRHQQLIRLDFEIPIEAGAGALTGPVAQALAAGAGVRAMVLSDYGKGTLNAAPALIAAGRTAGVSVLVDPKGTDFSRYRGASLITPNLAELEAVVGPCPDLERLAERGQRLRETLELDALLVTRGEEGMTLLTAQGPSHLPTHAREVYDVTGAGDTVIATLAASLAAGLPVTEATVLANLAASVVVGKLGTATVSLRELEGTTRGPAPDRGILERPELLRAVARARAEGRTVVMTNGCFDILHAGHVALLERAAALGDRLVVAVNDDASVGRLKGAERPVVPLAGRMRVLAGLASVDWVVAFSEDDPGELIREVGPDVLVKGGDYAPEAIAGAEHVLARGGRVEVLDYLPGNSTSAIVHAIRERAASA